VDSINDYNNITGEGLPRKIIFIDEVAELLKTRDKEISKLLYESLETLTRISRAVGISLIMGIQRPDSTIINGQIKSNVPFRICGRFVDIEPSRIMLGDTIASTLPNIKGRFIIKGDTLEEVQSFYFDKRILYNLPVKAKKEALAEVLIEEAVDDTLREETALKSENKLDFDFSDIEL